ncbi:MAG TPA: endonuclease, partial [Porphyromonadaceae bacterium]|nr:endonuclease [Porphyromonadaceae bacterium]
FIDYIFVNKQSVVINHNVLPEKLNDIYLSDHCPVTSQINLINP